MAGNLAFCRRQLNPSSFNQSAPLSLFMQCIRRGCLKDDIDRANWKFLWGEEEDKRSIHPVAWKDICKPKSMGGLGFKNLPLMNKASLAKLEWRLLQEPNSLWVRVLTAKYGSILLVHMAEHSLWVQSPGGGTDMEDW